MNNFVMNSPNSYLLGHVSDADSEVLEIGTL